MTINQLTWSAPATTGFKSISAVEGDDTWRITPVPRDVVRIGYNGRDTDGTFVDQMGHLSYAESIDEAKIVIDILRAGADALNGWHEQLEAAGFVQSYPDAEDGLACLWQDDRKSGLFQIDVRDAFVHPSDPKPYTGVHATYESGSANFWHNVCRIDQGSGNRRTFETGAMRCGLIEGADALKCGVAAALAIRAARQERGGRFATPLGGAPKA